MESSRDIALSDNFSTIDSNDIYVGEHDAFLTNPRAWYRHPILRIIVLFMILFMDFYTYGEDPVQDSRVLGTSVGTGQIAGLVCWFHVPTFLHGLLKFALCVITIVVSFIVGRWAIARGCCVNVVHFKSFKSAGGTIMCTLLMLAPTAFLLDSVYNSTLDPVTQADYMINSHSMVLFQGVFFLRSSRFNDLGKMWQGISATLDWISIFQICDAIFQDRKYWPEVLPRFKDFYNDAGGGRVRLLSTRIGLPLTCIITGYLVRCTGFGRGKISWASNTFGGNGEVVRSLLAAFIVFLDLFCLVQDWEFPLFSEHHLKEEHQTKMAGTNAVDFEFRCTGWCSRIRISQKWLQFAPLLGIMGADFAFVRSMYGYTPATYGQYVCSDGHIWTITDTAYLDEIYPYGFANRSRLHEITCETRRDANGSNLTFSAGTDLKNIAKYYDSGADYAGLGLAIFIFISFLVVVRCASTIALNEEVERWGKLEDDEEQDDCCAAPVDDDDDNDYDDDIEGDGLLR